jgi:methylated-DNA-[protein]-cysteine S-methyltransferase
MDCVKFERIQMEKLAGDATAEDEREAARHARTCDPCRVASEADGALEAAFRTDGEAALGGFDAAEAALRKTFDERRAACCRLEAPFGPVFLARTTRGICRVSFRSHTEDAFLRDLETRELLPSFEPDKLRAEARELEEYFGGRRRTFGVPLDLRFVTPFQERVLRAAADIPFGALASYSDIARRIGNPASRRAVGGALGHNPIPIIIPCHRVIAGNGSIGGYTGGLEIKRALFAIEGIALEEARR